MFKQVNKRKLRTSQVALEEKLVISRVGLPEQNPRRMP